MANQNRHPEGAAGSMGGKFAENPGGAQAAPVSLTHVGSRERTIGDVKALLSRRAGVHADDVEVHVQADGCGVPANMQYVRLAAMNTDDNGDAYESHSVSALVSDDGHLREASVSVGWVEEREGDRHTCGTFDAWTHSSLLGNVRDPEDLDAAITHVEAMAAGDKVLNEKINTREYAAIKAQQERNPSRRNAPDPHESTTVARVHDFDTDKDTVTIAFEGYGSKRSSAVFRSDGTVDKATVKTNYGDFTVYDAAQVQQWSEAVERDYRFNIDNEYNQTGSRLADRVLPAVQAVLDHGRSRR